MKLLQSFYGPILLAYTFIVNAVFSHWPSLADTFYLRGFYQGLRYTYDYLLAWLPVPMVYIVLAFLLAYMAKGLYILIRHGVRARWKAALLTTINTICLIISIFYWSWGYNYHVPNQSLVTKSENVVSVEYILHEIKTVQNSLFILRNSIDTTKSALDQELFTIRYQEDIRQAQENIIDLWDWPNDHTVNIRLIKPSGILLRFSTSGIYIPHSLEGHVDAGMSVLQYPATIAHEMAHGYGFTDEGFCNFIALLSCFETDSDYIRYSALLNYYRYLMSDLRKIDRALFLEYRTCINLGIRADLDEIYSYQARYPDIMPKVRDKIYDSYLKSHGVKEGLRSYNTLVRLVSDFKQDQKSQQVKLYNWLYTDE